MPNGPFIRPHPIVWRLVLATSIVYLLFLVFILFQEKGEVRQWLRFIDPTLGVALPEKSYATNCDLTWDNMSGQMDIFIIAHALGWFGKALIIRDYWFCWILSIMVSDSKKRKSPSFFDSLS